MSHLDGATTNVQGGAGEGLDAQSREADTRPDNVDDGIDGANFVEMDLLERHVVDSGFGNTETAEDGGCALLHRRRKRRLRNDVENRAERAVRVGVLGLDL